MIPFQIGRLGYHAQVYGAVDRLAADGLPTDLFEYLGQLYFDTVVHDPRALRLLIDVIGEDNVVLGSNYPGWDNAPIWETIRPLPDLSETAREKILRRNAAERLFHATP